MARCGRRDATVVGQVWYPYCCARSCSIRGVWRTSGWVGYRRVVGVLQPGASVRALERYRPDDSRDGRDIAHHPRVD